MCLSLNSKAIVNFPKKVFVNLNPWSLNVGVCLHEMATEQIISTGYWRKKLPHCLYLTPKEHRLDDFDDHMSVDKEYPQDAEVMKMIFILSHGQDAV